MTSTPPGPDAPRPDIQAPEVSHPDVQAPGIQAPDVAGLAARGVSTGKTGRAGGIRRPQPSPPWSVRVVRGRSMVPTLRDGDRLLVRHHSPGRAHDPHPGSLVVVRLPGGRPESVKRLLGPEPDGGWWVERDNPAEGVDSWLVGAIPDGDLLGVVHARLWPWPRRFRTNAFRGRRG